MAASADVSTSPESLPRPGVLKAEPAEALEMRRHAYQIGYLMSIPEEVESRSSSPRDAPSSRRAPAWCGRTMPLCALRGMTGTGSWGRAFVCSRGPKTNPERIGEVWAAMRAWRFIQIGCINHHRDGTPYVATQNTTPVRDDEGHL